jgi:hypothetical protein
MAKGGENGTEEHQTPSLLVRCQALRDEVGRVIQVSMERRRRFKIGRRSKPVIRPADAASELDAKPES